MAIEAKEVIMIAIGIILVIAVMFLIKYESRLKKSLDQRKDNRNVFYKKKLKAIKTSNIEQALNKVDRLAREFFSEAFGPDYHLECSDVKEKFAKINNLDCINFCSLMIELNYAGEKSDIKKVKKMISLLEKIISENKIPSKV
jgi:hypothetical protein